MHLSPTLLAHDRRVALPDGLHRFDTPADFFRALFGDPQHDAHLKARRWELVLRENEAASARAVTSIEDETAAIIAEGRERAAQRVAADYGYGTASIRAALHRWQSGCFSAVPCRDIRAQRVRELGRALDISIAWHGAASIAAE